MEFKYRQEHDTHPMDWDFETQLALESLQQQVKNGFSADQADSYMRKIFGGFFYTVEEANGTPPEL